MQQVHSEWGMLYTAIAMYQITLTSEEEKSYPIAVMLNMAIQLWSVSFTRQIHRQRHAR